MSQGPDFETPPSDIVLQVTKFADRMVTPATEALGYTPRAVNVYNNARFAAPKTPSLFPANAFLNPKILNASLDGIECDFRDDCGTTRDEGSDLVAAGVARLIALNPTAFVDPSA